LGADRLGRGEGLGLLMS